MINIIWKTIRKVGNIFHVKQMRKKLHNDDFTLISQNCVGGVIYHMLNIPFSSPTINMFIEDENFIKLVNNLRHYMSVEPTPITDEYIDPIDNNIRYPKIKIDDIEICCLHYKDCKQAIEAWNRRRQRINYNNILIIANSWNMHEREELVSEILNRKYRTICFTYRKMDYRNTIYLDGDFWKLDNRGIIRPNITDYKPWSCKRYFEDYVDIVEWINGDING